MISRARILPLVLVALGLAGSGRVSAQTMLSGRVVSGGRPVARAEIRLEAQQLKAETSDSGVWRLFVPNRGLVELSVRAIGFQPAARRLVLAGNDTINVEFSLDPTAQRLDSVSVEAPAAEVLGKMQGFEQRRRMGFGRFFTREMLAERENSIVSNVLRSGTGLRMMRRPETCGGGWAAASGRGGSLVREACGPTKFDPACYMAIYLDGVRLWAPGFSSGDPPPDIDRYKVSDFEGIEVYRSVAEAPIQYQAPRSDCGVLVLWTRVHHG
jgi:hypothetical protein